MEPLKFSTEKKIKKLNLTFGLAIAMVIFGLIQLGNKGFFNGGTFESLGNILDSLISFGIAIFLIIASSKKKREIEGEAVILTEDSLTIQKKSETYNFNKENVPSSIDKKLNSLEVTMKDGVIISVNLDNFSLEFSESKSLTNQVEKLRADWSLT